VRLRCGDFLASILLAALFSLLDRHARLWHPMWAADLGILPYQCARMVSGDFIYRDFFAKNPIGIFLLPSMVFRLFGPTIDSLAFLVALQFCSLVGATYLVARRTAPRMAWIVVPLYLVFCLRNCGLIHQPWAGACGPLAVLVLYDSLFAPRAPKRGWLPGGIMLGVVFLFHQVLFCTVTLAAGIFLLAGHGRREQLPLVALSCFSTVAGAILVLTLLAGPDLSMPRRLFELTVLTCGREASMLSLTVPNHPTLVTDAFALAQRPRDGVPGLVMEASNRWLAYFGFPILALTALWKQRAPDQAEGDPWLRWLLLAGAMIGLSAYPQFISGHMRAFVAPYSFALVARALEKPTRLRAFLWLVVGLSCVLGVREAAGTLTSPRYGVSFPAGTVYFSQLNTASEFHNVCTIMASEPTGKPLVTYPYFTMAYFLFQRTNPFRVHEITPALLYATGITVDAPVYVEGLRSIAASPPEFAFYDVREEYLLSEVERSLPNNGRKPLLDFINAHYLPVQSVSWVGRGPSLIVLRRKP
jgi:hypothetical protein